VIGLALITFVAILLVTEAARRAGCWLPGLERGCRRERRRADDVPV
jgi:hypothetical protein